VVHIARDGPAALQAVQDIRPEVIFLDIGLPALDGSEVARRIRQLPGGDQVLLYALTGWGQEEDRRRSHEAGFDRHLVKPLNPALLEALLGPVVPGR
jgi:CheY-like chemotaxis protein